MDKSVVVRMCAVLGFMLTTQACHQKLESYKQAQDVQDLSIDAKDSTDEGASILPPSQDPEIPVLIVEDSGQRVVGNSGYSLGGGGANARCGNGEREHIEQCDNGAANSDTQADACRTNCMKAFCGDGVTDSSEACDDAGESQGCNADCTLVVCGDGIVNTAAGEECDDAENNSDTEKNACRSNCKKYSCGDNVVDFGEQCDGGNKDPGDGCSQNCFVEFCGDGIIQKNLGESCDDGNTIDDGNGCDENCNANNVCGNGIVESGAEGCDDANSGACTPDCCFPLWEASFGDPLGLGDDDFVEAFLSGFVFPFQSDKSYFSVFINSNGNATFGQGDSDFTESVNDFLADSPRLGTLWDDLNPNEGGEIYFNDLGNRVAITWFELPEFFSSGSNTFQMQINHAGKVLMTYNGVSSDDSIVGVTPGNNAFDPGATNFNPTVPTSPLVFSTGNEPTSYQQFDDDDGGENFDLDMESLYFMPHIANNGWDISRFTTVLWQ